MRLRRSARQSAATRISADCSIGDLKLGAPVMPAAGTYGLSTEMASYGDLSSLGAFVTKSISDFAWDGNTGTNVTASRGGPMLNSVGLKNPGASDWTAQHYPELEQLGVPTIVSVWGFSSQDIADAVKKIAPLPGVVAIEVNLSCPNVEDPRLVISHVPARVKEYVTAVTEVAGAHDTAVLAKLAPTTPDMVSSARAAKEAGATGVTLVNTLAGMAIDLEAREPVLSGIFGGVSGPSLHPIALRAIYQVHSAMPELPIVGVGGVFDARSALELIAVGASAVQVGTASFADPRAPYEINQGVMGWLHKQGLSVGDLRGSVTTRDRPGEFGQVFQELIPAPAPPPGRQIPQLPVDLSPPARLPTPVRPQVEIAERPQ